MFELTFLQGKRTLLQGNKRVIIKTNNEVKLSSSILQNMSFNQQHCTWATGQFQACKRPSAQARGILTPSQKRVGQGPGAPGEGLCEVAASSGVTAGAL